MPIKYAAQTHPGCKRKTNEDSLLTDQTLGLYLLADGMGGHSAGEVASKKAVEIIGSFIRQSFSDREMTWPFPINSNLSWEGNQLVAAIKLASKSIRQTAKANEKLAGMGTTVAAIILSEQTIHIANVGDSRVYLIRNQQIFQLTEDHSLLAEQIKRNALSPQQIENYQYRNVITRALGIEDDVTVDVKTDQITGGDIFLLCTDGLNTQLTDTEICGTILAEPDICNSCELLIQKANKAGGKDNVTVIIVQVLP